MKQPGCKFVFKQGTVVGTITYQCCGVVHEDGYCRKHHKRREEKKIPFGKRENYGDVTEEEFLRGKTVQLKTGNSLGSSGGFRYKKGVMVSTGSDKQVSLPPDYTLYCTKRN